MVNAFCHVLPWGMDMVDRIQFSDTNPDVSELPLGVTAERVYKLCLFYFYVVSLLPLATYFYRSSICKKVILRISPPQCFLIQMLMVTLLKEKLKVFWLNSIIAS